MHELSIAQAIVDIVDEHLQARPEGRLLSIQLRVGRYRAVVPDSLRFCLSVLAEGTPMESAAVNIEEVPVQVHCETCGRDGALDDLYLYCPHCDAVTVTVIGGKELEIDSLEFDDA